jgi:leader peptidase (prepilin peptidase)/N-methyltransferase
MGALPLDLLLSPPLLALLGLCVGSFLNVVVHRMPLMMERQWWAEVAAHLQDADAWRRVFSPRAPGAQPPVEHQRTASELGGAVDALPALSIVRPRSRCPACGHELRWYENVPLLSWIMLRGRCSACGVRIGGRYPIVELATALLFGAVAWRFGAEPVTLAWCAFAACLLALALIDWDTTLLPDALTLPLLWGGLTAAALGWTVPLSSALWGAVAGYLSLWTVYQLFKLATGKEGMGHGDFKLLAALGAWTGWQVLPFVILVSAGTGAVIGGFLLWRSRSGAETRIPFGPYLALGGLAGLLYGRQAVVAWLGHYP